MLVGKIPFEAEGLGELLLKHMTEAPQPLRELEPSLPQNVEQAVLRALAKEPAQRFRRVEDFVAELGGQPTIAIEAARATAPLSAPVTVARANAVGAVDTIGAAAGETFAGTQPPGPRRSSILFAVVPAIAIFAIGLGVWFRPGTRPGDKPTEESSQPRAVQPRAMLPGVGQPAPPNAAPADTPRNIVEPATATAVPPPKLAEPPALVRLSVAATPSQAEIVVDGRRRDNPYAEDLPPDGHVYAVEVRASGYVTRREKLTLDQARHVGIELAPEHGAKHHGKSQPNTGSVAATQPTEAASRPATKTDHPGSSDKGGEEKGPTIYKGTKGKLITEDPFAKDPPSK